MITRIVMLFALVQILSNRPRLSTAAQSLPQKSNNVHLKHGVVLDFLQKVISTKNLAIDVSCKIWSEKNLHTFYTNIYIYIN